MRCSHFFAAVFIAVIIVPSALGDGKTGPRLQSILASGGIGDTCLVWVYFADKGPFELTKTAIPHDVVSERSLRRRSKVRTPDNLVDYSDLPICQEYFRKVASTVKRVRQVSRWFNSVSVVASSEQIATLGSFPFVRQLELVSRFKRGAEAPKDEHDGTAPGFAKQNVVHALDYGPSFDQLNQINVPALHDSGDFAQGVMVGVFDNGFRLLSHETFDTLRTRLVATRDFVDHKESVIPVNLNPGFGAHGVYTLSTIGGFTPGQLIGPAFGASFILARTENDSSETPIEEDNWAAAIEWAESLGVEVTSTSLGYFFFDPPYESLGWPDMDGKTSLITRAAVMAVSKGVVVLNSAGNEGVNRADSPNSLNAPADGDGVIAVGAVNPNGTRASFSSFGPTADGRIKPDVMAQGVAVVCAFPDAISSYGTEGGTSLSCPLAAGVAALLVKAYPHATPAQILQAMRATSSRASTPDNFYGWGILDALAAHIYLRDIGEKSTTGPYTLAQNYPNPFSLKTLIPFDLPAASDVTVRIFDLLGRKVRTLPGNFMPAGPQIVVWDAKGENGVPLASGVYFYRLEATGPGGGTTMLVRKMILLK